MRYYFLKSSLRLLSPFLILILLAACAAGNTSSSSDSDSPANDDNTGYTVTNGRIFKDGEAINVFGVNWFGFETSDHVMHGLWERPYADIIAQIKDSGFNAVRLPFCPDTSTGVATSSISSSQNPDVEDLDSLQALDLIVNALNDAALYILLDHHRPDCEEISELWYTDSYSEDDWISDLNFVASRYEDLDYFLGIDLKNEPHGDATWGSGVAATDWNEAAERAAASVLTTNPNILIFVEGIQDNDNCDDTGFSHWWGGALEGQRCFPLDIDSEKLVLSPHVYGPDVSAQSYFSDADFPDNMPAIWDAHFGFLVDSNFAVVPGEFGGQFGEGEASDEDWQVALIDYFIDKEICDFFYWSWNPNSGDTGGLVEDDWETLEQGKYDNLKRLMDFCVAE